MGRSPRHARMVRRCSRPFPNEDVLLGTGRGGYVCPSGFEATLRGRWQAGTIQSGQVYQTRVWASPGSLRWQAKPRRPLLNNHGRDPVLL
jgi:hypothetical protein